MGEGNGRMTAKVLAVEEQHREERRPVLRPVPI